MIFVLGKVQVLGLMVWGLGFAVISVRTVQVLGLGFGVWCGVHELMVEHVCTHLSFFPFPIFSWGFSAREDISSGRSTVVHIAIAVTYSC